MDLRQEELNKTEKTLDELAIRLEELEKVKQRHERFLDTKFGLPEISIDKNLSTEEQLGVYFDPVSGLFAKRESEIYLKDGFYKELIIQIDDTSQMINDVGQTAFYLQEMISKCAPLPNDIYAGV